MSRALHDYGPDKDMCALVILCSIAASDEVDVGQIDVSSSSAIAV